MRFCGSAVSVVINFEQRLIDERQNARSVPDDVFCFARSDVWKPVLWNILGDFLTQSVKEEFVRNPPKYVVSDDLSWLDEIIMETSDNFVAIKELTANRIARHYRAFRAAHGTRTDNLTSFYHRGLRRLRSGEIEDIARKLLINASFPYANEKSLMNAIDELDAKGPGCRDGFLYFCADEHELIDQASHYLIYGSEYLYCIAMRVIGTWNAQRLLKSIGEPTMIVCDLPFEFLSQDQREDFAGMCLEIMFTELLGETDEYGHGSAVMLSCDVSSDCIVGHYHPSKIRDPFL